MEKGVIEGEGRRRRRRQATGKGKGDDALSRSMYIADTYPDALCVRLYVDLSIFQTHILTHCPPYPSGCVFAI